MLVWSRSRCGTRDRSNWAETCRNHDLETREEARSQDRGTGLPDRRSGVCRICGPVCEEVEALDLFRNERNFRARRMNVALVARSCGSVVRAACSVLFRSARRKGWVETDEPVAERDQRTDLQEPFDSATVDISRRREPDTAAGAGEQPDSDFAFQVRDEVTDGRLLEPQSFGGAGKALVARCGQEGAQGIRSGQGFVRFSEHDRIGINFA